MLICACRQKHILCILDARWHSMIPQQLNRNKGMHRDGNNILQSLHDSAWQFNRAGLCSAHSQSPALFNIASLQHMTTQYISFLAWGQSKLMAHKFIDLRCNLFQPSEGVSYRKNTWTFLVPKGKAKADRVKTMGLLARVQRKTHWKPSKKSILSKAGRQLCIRITPACLQQYLMISNILKMAIHAVSWSVAPGIDGGDVEHASMPKVDRGACWMQYYNFKAEYEFPACRTCRWRDMWAPTMASRPCICLMLQCIDCVFVCVQELVSTVYKTYLCIYRYICILFVYIHRFCLASGFTYMLFLRLSCMLMHAMIKWGGCAGTGEQPDNIRQVSIAVCQVCKSALRLFYLPKCHIWNCNWNVWLQGLPHTVFEPKCQSGPHNLCLFALFCCSFVQVTQPFRLLACMQCHISEASGLDFFRKS